MRYEYTQGGIEQAVLEANLIKLAQYKERLTKVVEGSLYTEPESSLVVLFDDAHWLRAQEIAKEIGPLKHLVVVGIGGSSMAIEALYKVVAKRGEHPILHVLDVLDEEALMSVVNRLGEEALQDFAIVIISKSGTTTETLANADALITKLTNHFGDAVYGRVVAVGNPGTPLATLSQKQGVRYAIIPEMVGGRFSVFTAVGLVPLALMGVDATPLLSGARAQIQQGLRENSSASIAGVLLASHITQGTRVQVLFYEQRRLEGFARWYQQLLAESLGKTNTKGEKVGIVPVLMSPADLHSTAQLFLSGFESVWTSFVGASPENGQLTLTDSGYGSLLSLSANRSFGHIPGSIMKGVHAAYMHEHLPHTRMEMESVSLEELGACMAEKMLEVMYAAHILSIDAFDQPHVELYKKETKAILQEEKV